MLDLQSVDACALAEPDFRFIVVTEPEAQTMLRVLGFFSQLGLIPKEVLITNEADRLRFSIRQSGLSPLEASRIAYKLRVLVRTISVELMPET